MQRHPVTSQEFKSPLTWRVVPDGHEWMIVDDDIRGYFDKSDAIVTFGLKTESSAQAYLAGALMSWAHRFPDRVQ
jgi:hypothetical protein